MIHRRQCCYRCQPLTGGKPWLRNSSFYTTRFTSTREVFTTIQYYFLQTRPTDWFLCVLSKIFRITIRSLLSKCWNVESVRPTYRFKPTIINVVGDQTSRRLMFTDHTNAYCKHYAIDMDHNHPEKSRIQGAQIVDSMLELVVTFEGVVVDV